MTKRDQLLADLQGDKAYGVFLMAQMDSVPETLQLVIATTEIDDKLGRMRDKYRYVIRAIGVKEHRVSVGLFGNLRFLSATEHPLLYQYNTTPVGLFFRGTPHDPNALLVDIFQAYASTFGAWRQIPSYFNVSKPLLNLLTSGGDLLGEMPKPLADNLIKLLEQHKLETKVIEGETPTSSDEFGRSRLMQALVMDESYIVAHEFTVELLGK